MKKINLIVFIITVLFSVPEKTFSQDVNSIQELFSALKTHPEIIGDSISYEKAKTGKQLANSNLFPKISAFGTYDNYSSPTGMLPVSPNDLFPLIQDQSIPQPFSENIFRVGIGVSMPIFIKSIYTTAKKATYLQESRKVKNEINLLRNEAIIVSSNANLQYIDALTNALERKKQSLLKTKELITLKVKNGRAPGSSLLIIDNGINQVEATKNQIAISREKAIAIIETLTGIRMGKPIEMIETNVIDTSNIKSLEPLKQKVASSKYNLRSEKEKLLPSLVLRGNYNHSFANAYNNNLAIEKNYATIGLVVGIPLFNKSQYTQIKKSEIAYNLDQNEYEKIKLSLKSQAKQLENSLQLLYKSEILYQQSIKDKKEILDIATASYLSNRISIEDYLKYEDDLVLEKSKLYKSQAEKWQTLVKLAVIYGNNIEKLVK